MPAAAPNPASGDALKIQQFGGMLPAWDALLLPDGQAQSSTNGYLFSGGLEGWRVPKLLRTTSLSNPNFIYRVPDESSARASVVFGFPTNPQAGDTVTVGEETYAFTAAVTSSSASYTVKIGANAIASAINLFAALTYDNGAGTNAGTLYGVGTVANPAIDQTSTQTLNVLQTDTTPPAVTVVAPDVGAAYNTTTVGVSAGGRITCQYNGIDVTTLMGGVNVTINTSITGGSTFLEFVDPNTDVLRTPLVDDQFDRFYIASSTQPPQYNTRDRIQSGKPAYLLGIPAPGCTPTIEVTGGGSSAQIGYATSSSVNVSTPGANTIYLVPVTPDGALTLDDISIMPASSSATVHYTAVVYSDLDGDPHELLNAGVQETGMTAGQAAVSAFVNPTGLLMNVRYWIGIRMDEAIEFQLADDTSTTGVISTATYSNGTPPVITQLSVGKPSIQVWGDLTTSSVQEARTYVYTYISAFGEESAPSPPTTAVGWANGTWTIGLFQPPADQLGVKRDITQIRLYRTITALSGGTTFYAVDDDFPVTQGTYVDVIDDSVVVNNLQLQSQLWTPPPEGLQGFVMMPNGVIAGWQKNEIWFCEPYRPHAWPASYVQTTEYPIVGLGVTGGSLVACTTGAPYVTTGVSPASMTATKIDKTEPCHSRKSIIGDSDGVYYCSPNGLIRVTQYGQLANTTETWITREKWQQLTPQNNVVAVLQNTSYFAYQVGVNGNEQGLGQTGFVIELNQADAKSFTIWPQPGGHRMGFQLMTNQLTDPIAMLQVDPWSGVAFVISRNAMYQYDYTDTAPTLSVVDWKSKKYQQKAKKNFSAMRIQFTVPPNTPAQNAVRAENDTSDTFWTSPLPTDRYGFILVYSGGRLVTAREIRNDKEILRIESGFKNETWEFRIISRIHISNVQIGSSVKALANV